MRKRQADVLAGAQKPAVAEHQRGRQQPATQHLARAVQVREQQIQQLGALHEAGLNGGPLVAGDQQRRHVERPRLALAIGAIDVVAGAGLVQQAPRLAGATGQRGGTERAQ